MAYCWAIIIWLAVINTAFAFTLWNHTLRTLTAVELSVINGLMMPQIALLAFVFLGEPLSTKEVLGLIPGRHWHINCTIETPESSTIQISMPDLKSKLPAQFAFSQSSLQDYADCPRRFQLRYLDKLIYPAAETEPALENEKHLQEGQNFHRLAQQYLLGIPTEKLESWPTRQTCKSGGRISWRRPDRSDRPVRSVSRSDACSPLG